MERPAPLQAGLQPLGLTESQKGSAKRFSRSGPPSQTFLPSRWVRVIFAGQGTGSRLGLVLGLVFWGSGYGVREGGSGLGQGLGQGLRLRFAVKVCG